MNKEECRHCICVAEGNNGEWVCDELSKPITTIEECPERIKGDVE